MPPTVTFTQASPILTAKSHPEFRPAQIHYTAYDAAFDQISLVFTRNMSALDLATTPLALRLAMEHNKRITDLSQCRGPAMVGIFFSYQRRDFPAKYHPFHSAWLLHHFPSLHSAVTSYEQRSLLPVVLPELRSRRSIPLLFDSEGRLMPRHRTEQARVLTRVAQRRFGIVRVLNVLFGMLNLLVGMLSVFFQWIIPYFNRPIPEDVETPSTHPRPQLIDALDLRSVGDTTAIIHTECVDCYPRFCGNGVPHNINFEQCLITLMWERRLYDRGIYVPYRQRDDSRPDALTRLWRWRSPLGAILVAFGCALLCILGAPVSLFWMCFYLGLYVVPGFLVLNSVSGGALLASLGTRLHFLGSFINHIDKKICREVVAGELPCIITANPDVAGIGGRTALYTQAILLITLLALSPRQAGPSRWALATTSLAFGVSTLVSAATNQLSLYHIILAAKFQSLPLIITTIVEVKSPRYRDASLFIANRMRWLVNAAIILWYSLTAPCFGVGPACNVYVRSQSYFTIGNATKMPQRLTSVFNVTITLLFIVNDVYRTLYKHKRKYPRRKADWLRLREVTTCSGLYSVNWLFDNKSPSLRVDTTFQSLPLPATMVIPRVNRIRRKAHAMTAYIVAALPYPKFQRYIIALAFTIMLVCNIENTIVLNTVGAGEDTWTYGQILAIVLTVVPVVQVLQMLGLWLTPSTTSDKSKGD